MNPEQSPTDIRSADIDRRLSKMRSDAAAYYCLTCSDENYYFFTDYGAEKGRLG